MGGEGERKIGGGRSWEGGGRRSKDGVAGRRRRRGRCVEGAGRRRKELTGKKRRRGNKQLQ